MARYQIETRQYDGGVWLGVATENGVLTGCNGRGVGHAGKADAIAACEAQSKANHTMTRVIDTRTGAVVAEFGSAEEFDYWQARFYAIHYPDRKPIAETAERLTGPTWRDSRGLHRVTFTRMDTASYGADPVNVWRMVHTLDGSIFLVVDMRPCTDGVCDTATGALWALRGIVAGYMRNDVRNPF